MSEGFDKTFATEERPCGDCFWFRIKTDIPLCEKKLMGVTSTLKVTYRISTGTCFEAQRLPVERHYFMTSPDVHFPDNRFCAKCGAYFTHPNHLHGRDCQCKTCKSG